MNKKILIAVDASVYSSNTLHYIEQLFKDVKDIHFHLLSAIPCSSLQAGHEWLDDLELLSKLSPAARKRYTAAKKYMNESVERLDRHGISKNQITTEIKLSRTNVASDIIDVARKGLYDALVIGRRGVSKLEELIMGSVSRTVFEKCHDMPIWIVDGQVDSRTFLLPVDGSEYCLKAVDHLAFILKDNPYAEITLFHSAAMFAQKQSLNKEECTHYLTDEYCQIHAEDPEIHFHAPEQILKENGFPAERIHRLLTQKGMYPSRQIVRQALIDDFGTIVMGRRGIEMKKGVFGSVTEKVVAMSVNTAIWILG
jgi:nucleotide-binding universal stress UspA family protein